MFLGLLVGGLTAHLSRNGMLGLYVGSCIVAVTAVLLGVFGLTGQLTTSEDEEDTAPQPADRPG